MIDFSEVQNSVRELKSQLTANQIEEKAFEDRLLEMIDLAEDGYYWMFGHETERWFRHDGQKWVPDDPSKILAKSSQQNSTAPGHSAVEQNDELEALPINWSWFIVSILIIIIIGWIVYSSSLG